MDGENLAVIVEFRWYRVSAVVQNFLHPRLVAQGDILSVTTLNSEHLLKTLKPRTLKH